MDQVNRPTEETKTTTNPNYVSTNSNSEDHDQAERVAKDAAHDGPEEHPVGPKPEMPPTSPAPRLSFWIAWQEALRGITQNLPTQVISVVLAALLATWFAGNADPLPPAPNIVYASFH